MGKKLEKRCKDGGAYRDENKNGTWYCKFSYVNWKGEKLNKKKRRF